MYIFFLEKYMRPKRRIVMKRFEKKLLLLPIIQKIKSPRKNYKDLEMKKKSITSRDAYAK